MSESQKLGTFFKFKNSKFKFKNSKFKNLNSKIKMAQDDPREMLNNFGFHV